MSEITYTKQDDYLIPDLTLPTEPELPLGRYALMHRDYLEKHKRVTFLNLLTSGRLNAHLHQTEQAALSRLELLTTVCLLLELAVDAVFAVLEATAFGEDAVNVLLRIVAP